MAQKRRPQQHRQAQYRRPQPVKMQGAREVWTAISILGFAVSLWFGVSWGFIPMPAVPTGIQLALPGMPSAQPNFDPPPPATPTCLDEGCRNVKEYARQLLEARGQGAQFGCLERLWTNESAWEPGRLNPSSFAAGIPQALPGSKIYGPGFKSMARVNRGGRLYLANPNPQLEVQWGVDYILGRYKTPCNAWAFWQRTDARPHPGHWY